MCVDSRLPRQHDGANKLEKRIQFRSENWHQTRKLRPDATEFKAFSFGFESAVYGYGTSNNDLCNVDASLWRIFGDLFSSWKSIFGLTRHLNWRVSYRSVRNDAGRRRNASLAYDAAARSRDWRTHFCVHKNLGRRRKALRMMTFE